MTSWHDPLYLPRTALPEGASVLRLGGLDVVVTVEDTEPDAVAAMWMPDRAITLVITDEIGAEELRAVLPEFLEHAETLADRPSLAWLTLPSRDIDRGLVAREAGLAPWSMVAVRDLSRRSPGADDGAAPVGVDIRDATEADADTVCRLWWEQAEYEARLGTFRATPAIRASLEASMPATIAGGGITLVAERDGELVGLVNAESMAESAWVGARLALDPVAYLALGSTTAASRSAGVGTALVNELHRRMIAAGAQGSALHYSAYNPLSIPFWSQRGYRPVLTSFAGPISPRP